jgi:hypothetical protein
MKILHKNIIVPEIYGFQHELPEKYVVLEEDSNMTELFEKKNYD